MELDYLNSIQKPILEVKTWRYLRCIYLSILLSLWFGKLTFAYFLIKMVSQSFIK